MKEITLGRAQKKKEERLQRAYCNKKPQSLNNGAKTTCILIYMQIERDDVGEEEDTVPPSSNE